MKHSPSRIVQQHSSRICPTVLSRALASIGAYVFLTAAVAASAQTVPARSVPANDVPGNSPAIVIGFVGGFVAHNNSAHGEVQLAERLRRLYHRGVDVETFESYRGKEARLRILKILGANDDGNPTMAEKHNARIIIYGHSWGGAESVYLARKLEKDGIPVLLTVQVDSISRFWGNDTTIPGNVAQVANFYQPHGLLRGHHDIRAADATKTRIIGNFRFDYGKSSLKCAAYPWYDRVFVKAHTQIECDPVIWERVESLIGANLPPATPTEFAQ